MSVLSQPGCQRGAFRTAAIVAALGLLPSTPFAQVETFPLSPPRAARLGDAVDTAAGPDDPWNCMCVELAGLGLNVIMPLDAPGDPTRETELLSLAKVLVGESLLASSGTIAAMIDTGTWTGFELDLFGDSDPGLKPDATEVAAVAELTDGGAVVGQLYCYTPGLMQARVAALEASMGGSPLSAFQVYAGPTLESSDPGYFAMFLLTDESEVQGEVRANGRLRITGNENTVPELLRYVEGYEERGTGNVLGEWYQDVAEPVAEPPRPAWAYELLALANNTFFNESITIEPDGAGGLRTTTNVPISGVVYSTGRILLEGDGTTAELTLVAEGGVELGASGCKLTPSRDALLVWAVDDGDPGTSADVVVVGADNVLSGRLVASGGGIEVLGDRLELLGSLAGQTILLTGDGHAIGDGTKQD